MSLSGRIFELCCTSLMPAVRGLAASASCCDAFSSSCPSVREVATLVTDACLLMRSDVYGAEFCIRDEFAPSDCRIIWLNIGWSRRHLLPYLLCNAAPPTGSAGRQSRLLTTDGV